MTRITATEASRNFSDLLNRVHYRGERFEVSRGKEVVARIEPAEDKPPMTAAEFFRWFTQKRWLDPEDSLDYERQLRDIRQASGWSDRQWD